MSSFIRKRIYLFGQQYGIKFKKMLKYKFKKLRKRVRK